MNTVRPRLDLPEGPTSTSGGPPPRAPGEPERRGSGGGRYRRVLPWLFLGAGFIALERVTMLVFIAQDLPVPAYAAAGGVLGSAILAALVLGGRAFWRAWHAEAVAASRR